MEARLLDGWTPAWTPQERADVLDALALAQSCHAGQTRRSGEPFVEHPIRVARRCGQLGADAATVIAALLHDSVEDTDVTFRDLRERYGQPVAELVGGVTKIEHFPGHHASTEAETYRKLLIASAEDWRVILIKLADRLDNMETIAALPEARQRAIAEETLAIYAPIAHRLGIHVWKAQLEDLCLRVIDEDAYAQIRSLVATARTTRQAELDDAVERLAGLFSSSGVTAEISGRPKHFYSIYKKMRAGRDFSEIYDLMAIRVITESLSDCYAVLGLVHGQWKPLPSRIKDYIAMPKPNLYQSLHTTVVTTGQPLEIQIRTRHMHAIAEWGVAAHVLYKEGGAGPSDPHLRWLQAVRDWQQQLSSSEFLDELRTDVLGQEVFVFTPRGDVKALPTGATPLDLAYAIHTEVGHRCVGARVNGKLVPLHARLRNGDQVEILTGQRSGPSRDWLALVVSRSAKGKIRAYFRDLDRHDHETRGREMLEAALGGRAVPISALAAMGQRLLGRRTSANDLYRAIGDGRLGMRAILREIDDPGPARPEEAPLALVRRRPRPDQPVVLVDAPDMQTEIELARCCTPVPPEEIAGYVSQGRGVRVHRVDCPQLPADRRLAVAWSGGEVVACIVIDGWDRVRLLEDLSRVMAELGVNIYGARCATDDGFIHNRFEVGVRDVDELHRVLARLRQIDGVFDAQRVDPSAQSTA